MSKDRKKFKSALHVNPGIEQPQALNPNAINRFSHQKRIHSEAEYLNGILQGNRTILGKAITLIESTLPLHQQMAQRIIEKCLPYAGNSIRIGITGVPGVGKSTFIEALGMKLTQKGHKLAVLAIDPSSKKSKGSILADKTRMEELSATTNAFIRPSPSAGTLGGVARKTRETIILCEAAGYDVVFVETVGVGQSETTVHDMVDFFLLLMLAGAGDELQGIKRGIMEMADGIVINKAEAENLPKAMIAKSQLVNALHLFPPNVSGWEIKVETCSAYTGQGILNVWDLILDYIEHTKTNGYFQRRRTEQDKKVMINMIEDELLQRFNNSKKVKDMITTIEEGLSSQKFSAYIAAEQLIDAYLGDLGGK
ncbi:MAG: methylmalonyl Co-A mutase-associated GTPase MeaB [Bacteroidales bacterium]|nr:methylmalonyl Co-A mutase-associated GTPase MeaB [Bacteroidales bacterium]MDZ4204223.1 methylmalonyl Co-A mutase-associated GTPase MeaB [Bacteroidales bacterium]